MPSCKMKMIYSEQEDKLYLTISDEPEKGSMELGPNITAELNEDGELIGLEILNASGVHPGFCCRLLTGEDAFCR